MKVLRCIDKWLSLYAASFALVKNTPDVKELENIFAAYVMDVNFNENLHIINCRLNLSAHSNQRL